MLISIDEQKKKKNSPITIVIVWWLVEHEKLTKIISSKSPWQVQI